LQTICELHNKPASFMKPNKHLGVKAK